MDQIIKALAKCHLARAEAGHAAQPRGAMVAPFIRQRSETSASAVGSGKAGEDLGSVHRPSNLATDAVCHHLPHSSDANGLKLVLEECHVRLQRGGLRTGPSINVLLSSSTAQASTGCKSGSDLKCHKNSQPLQTA